jgi:hypothetical protein
MTKMLVWFSLAIAGCSIPTKHAGGGDDDATGDGGTGSDGGGSAGTTLVELSVLSTSFDGLPDTGATAVFLDPGGALIADGLVDGAGHAQADMPNGGSVTVIRIADQSSTERDVTMTTITSVKPGDKLVVGSTLSPRAFPGTPATMNVAFTPYAANYSYMFYTACGGIGGSSGAATIYLYDTCHGGTFDLVAVATSTSTPPDVRYVNLPNVTYAANGSITVPNTWMTSDSFMATLANVPVGISNLALTHSSYLGETPAAPGDVSADSPAPGVVSMTAAYVQGLGTRSQVDIALHDTNASGFQRFSARVASVAGTQGLDLSQEPLPWIVGALTETPTSIAWEQLNTGTPDVRLVTWAGHWAVGARTDYINWTIEDGTATTSLTLPGLPSKYGEYDPAQATSVVLGHGGVQYIDVDRLHGYDEARAYGPNLSDAFEDLGVFVDMPIQRRISRNALFL